MARYEHLPIYRDALNLAVHFEKIVAGFSRYHKYTLGTEMRNASRQAVKMVIHANNQTDKLLALQELREHLEELLLLIRLGKEVQAFKSFNVVSCLFCYPTPQNARDFCRRFKRSYCPCLSRCVWLGII